MAYTADWIDFILRHNDVGAVGAQSPTLLSANIAFRINAYGDYGVANALGTLSLLMTAFFAVVYLRISMREKA